MFGGPCPILQNFVELEPNFEPPRVRSSLYRDSFLNLSDSISMRPDHLLREKSFCSLAWKGEKSFVLLAHFARSREILKIFDRKSNFCWNLRIGAIYVFCANLSISVDFQWKPGQSTKVNGPNRLTKHPYKVEASDQRPGTPRGHGKHSPRHPLKGRSFALMFWQHSGLNLIENISPSLFIQFSSQFVPNLHTALRIHSRYRLCLLSFA